MTATVSAAHYPPGPKNDLATNARLVVGMNGNLLGTLQAMQQEYGDIVFTTLLGRQFSNVFHPDPIHQILVEMPEKFHKTQSYSDGKLGLARFLGNGLLISEGEFWRRQRKLMQPGFHSKRIDSYAQVMVDFTVRMLEGWQPHTHINVASQMMRLTLGIVAKALFNTDVAADSDRIGHAVDVLQEVNGQPVHVLPAWVPTPRRLGASAALRDLDEIVYRMIAEHRKAGRDSGDLLSMLMLAQDEDGSVMTDKQLRDEAVTLVLAGHETTANALNWAWYLLAQHPAVEAKLHQELDSVLAGRAPTLADLDKLTYTDMIIKEVLRLYPPAFAFGRMATEEVVLGGYTLPKGCEIFVCTYLLHRDPRWFDDPLAFRPERFSPDNEKNISRRAYIPFGGGPRICIGNSFALMEARLLLATIASRYRLRLAPGHAVQLDPKITLRPKGGLIMSVEQRLGN